MERWTDRLAIRPRTLLVTAFILVLLLVTQHFSFALFHTVAELFAIIVAVSVFMVMWNSRRFLDNNYLLFLGISLLFIAAIDAAHLITYRGVGIIPDAGVDLPTQFWIAGRFLQAGVFLVAPSLLDRRKNVRVWVSVLALLSAALIAAVVSGLFPTCLTATGLTVFKRVSEYLIIGLLCAALFRLRARAERFDDALLGLVSASILVTAGSEFFFTLYSDPFGVANLVGHFLRIIAFYLLYRATVQAALQEPYGVLFRELAQYAEALRISEERERHAKEAQREIAEKLQRSMLYVSTDTPGVRLGHTYRSADELALIGGDLYDAVTLADGRVAFYLGDVSGKGIDAATASSVVRTTLRVIALSKRTPSEVLAAANRVLLSVLPSATFATAVFGVLDTDARTLVLANAGHPDPYRCAPDACEPLLVERGVPLGLFDDSVYPEASYELAPDDIVVFYSDGLLDTRKGQDFFGEERIRAALDGLHTRSPQRVAEGLLASAERFAEGHHADDIAVLAFSYGYGDGETRRAAPKDRP
ncbi:MAG: hypothetical protein Kow0067_13760 [Coriobacteriia bacterium]